MNKIFSLFTCISLLSTLQAETTFSLEECIKYALKHSSTIKKSKIEVESSKEQILIETADFDFTLDAGSSRQIDDREDNHSATISKRLPGGITVATSGQTSNDHTNDEESNSIDFTITKRLLDGASELEDLVRIQDAENRPQNS